MVTHAARRHAAAENSGDPVDAECTDDANTILTGGPNPDKGCCEHYELKYPPESNAPCFTYDDTGMVASTIDAFVQDVVVALDPGSDAGRERLLVEEEKLCREQGQGAAELLPQGGHQERRGGSPLPHESERQVHRLLRGLRGEVRRGLLDVDGHGDHRGQEDDFTLDVVCQVLPDLIACP